MESKNENDASIGSSLAVPCVQELIKEPLINVPDRYIRPDQEFLNVANNSSENDQIPVIDFQKLYDPDSKDSELDKLHSACKDWGFFQLVNHGVSSSLLDRMKTEVQDFFNLPMEEKRKYWQYPGEIEGFGQVFVVSEEQKLDWCDVFLMTTLPVHLRKPHLFPHLPLPFRYLHLFLAKETLESYSLELKNLAVDILEWIAKCLQIKPEEMREHFTEGVRQMMRMNYYPPCPQPEKVIGLTSHADGSGLTILLQANDVEGLQIMKDSKWVPIKPLPNAFVVNIGNMLEIMSNGAYRSVLHRATVNSLKERLSIGAFHTPRIDGEVGPLPSLITDQKPAMFKRLTIQEYFKGYFSRELREKSYLDTLRIQRHEV